jgi:hypothetical protein
LRFVALGSLSEKRRAAKPRLVLIQPIAKQLIDRYSGYCFQCGKDRTLSEIGLVHDADRLPHIVCSTRGQELTYVPI